MTCCTDHGSGPTSSRPGVIKLIGVLEVLAAIGLVLPAVLDIAPVLRPASLLRATEKSSCDDDDARGRAHRARTRLPGR